jgi:hypothetical protein
MTDSTRSTQPARPSRQGLFFWILAGVACLVAAASVWLALLYTTPDVATDGSERVMAVPTPPFKTIGKMNTPRSAFAAVVTGNDVCVAIGGEDASGHALATWEAFDPATGRTVKSGVLPEPRVGHTATVLADGSIFVAGGWDGKAYTNRCLLLDVTTGKLTEGPMLRFPRRGAAAIALDKGVLIAGGADTEAGFEFYDAATGVLKHYSGPGGTLTGAALVRFDDVPFSDASTICLLAGGRKRYGGAVNEAWVIDTRTMKAEAAGRMTHARADCCVIGHSQYGALLAGGVDSTGRPLSSVDRFDSVTHMFRAGPPLLWPVSSPGAASRELAGDFVVYLIAGGTPGEPSAKTQMLWGGQQEFVRGPDLITARYAPQALSIDSSGIVIKGGTTTGGGLTAACELHDLKFKQVR